MWIDGETVAESDLEVPHPRMFDRAFVMIPLAELAPDLAAAHNGLGAARNELGDVAGARASLARAAALDPTDPNPLLNLARLRRRAGDESGASDALSEALARGYAP